MAVLGGEFSRSEKRGQRPLSQFFKIQGDSWPLSGASFWLSVGNLNNGGNAGLWYVNANNGVANARWNIGSRQSVTQGLGSEPATSTASASHQGATRHARSFEQNRLKSHRASSCGRPLGRQTESWLALKTYCKRLDITREHVLSAYEAWSRGESGHRNGWRVGWEYGSADALVDEIYAEVRSQSLAFAPIRRSLRRDPSSGKMRVIGVEGIKQQVCDYLASMLLDPLISAKTGFYQCANVRGKGLRLCRSTIRRWSRLGGYHIRADVRKCYPSISTKVVSSILRRYVASADVLYVCDAILATYDGGLEIGSYFSLRMAQLVLSFAYHHVEGLGKRRRGRWVPLVRHQIWHLDDVILVGPDKRDLRRAMRSFMRYCRRELGIAFKPWKVRRTGRVEPLDMAGYRACDGRLTLRRHLYLRMTRAFLRFGHRPSVARARRAISYWGWAKGAGCQLVAKRFHGLFAMARGLVSRYERRYGNGTHTVCNAA